MGSVTPVQCIATVIHSCVGITTQPWQKHPHTPHHRSLHSSLKYESAADAGDQACAHPRTKPHPEEGVCHGGEATGGKPRGVIGTTRVCGVSRPPGPSLAPCQSALAPLSDCACSLVRLRLLPCQTALAPLSDLACCQMLRHSLPHLNPCNPCESGELNAFLLGLRLHPLNLQCQNARTPRSCAVLS
jgi:hypothetical protein